MSDAPMDYGLLLGRDMKLHRERFKEMVKLIGVNCIYYAPKKGLKENDTHGDLLSRYELPAIAGCIFEQHPDQKTLKKHGWVTELSEGSSMIHVPYDLPGLERGALFVVPSGLDDGEGRFFRVLRMQNIMVYPASIACEIAPEYEDDTPQEETEDFSKNTFTKLLDNEGDD